MIGVTPAVPKAELHVHLEDGAASLIRLPAERNGIPLPEGLFADEDTFRWTDFLDFLATYDMAASVIRTARTTATSPTSTCRRARRRTPSTSS